MAPSPGKLVVMSGPSGVGKSTLVRKVLLRTGDRLRKSVSATTRPPRPGEADGVDYHFLAADEFRRRVAAGEFLEAIEVFGRGHWYGTLLAEVLPSLDRGSWVLLEIDVDGAERALARYPDAVTLFVVPADRRDESERVLEERLRARGTEDEASLRRRLEVARHELDRASDYKHLIVNEGLDDAVDRIVDVLVSEGFPLP
ncbi:MAG: guanylate kinase [Lacipirellulaceae bacterium]